MSGSNEALSAPPARAAAAIVRSAAERQIFIGGLGLTVLFFVALTGLALTIPNL